MPPPGPSTRPTLSRWWNVLSDECRWRPLRLCLLSPQREPSIDLLEAFVEHWKGITNYYIESTGAAWSPSAQGSLEGAGRKVWVESPCSSEMQVS